MMTIPHHSSSSSSTAFPSPSLLDLLYCKEEQVDDCFWDEKEEAQEHNHAGLLLSKDDTTHQNPSFLSLLSFLQHHSDDDDELRSLHVKEQQIHNNATHFDHTFRTLARREAVEWILKVNTYYGFTTITAILSINYLDRFLSLSPQFRRRDDNDDNSVSTSKPWLIQLVAVTCVSLAAKVEETEVPLLLDLQIEGTKYVFEAKTIQKMELLVLSTLDWKMSAVTPVSFLDHFVKRFQMSSTTHHHYGLHWEFYRRCERLLLTAVADSRFVRYLPSVLATSTIMHVIDQMEHPHHHPVDYQNQLLRVLTITKEEVKDCYALILEIFSSSYSQSNNMMMTMSRKRYRDGVVNDDDDLLLCNEAAGVAPPASPSGVIDAYFGSDSSNESWSSTSSSSSSSSTFSSLSTSFVHGRTAAPLLSLLPQRQGGRWGKKARVYEQYMRRSSPSPTAFSSSPLSHRRRLNLNAAGAGPR